MKYIEARFKITCSADILQTCKDLLMDLAGDAGFESFNEEAGEVHGYAQKALFNRDVLDREISHFPVAHVKIGYTISDVADVDWNQTWEENGFEPINVDDRILIYDARHTTSDKLTAAGGQMLIGIDAVQAFGSGAHQTTRLMLSALLRMDPADRRVLDCGCGTGILGIAASMLGARTVVAFDIDEWSVDNTWHNAMLNGTGNLHVLHGDAAVIPDADGPFDVVMANINRNILLRDLPAYVRAMSPDSALIISGFFTTDAPLLQESAAALGLQETDCRSEDEWCCIAFRKLSASH